MEEPYACIEDLTLGSDTVIGPNPYFKGFGPMDILDNICS